MGTQAPNPAGGAAPIRALPEIPSIANTYGAILLGTFVSLMLYGLTIHQAYRYARMHNRDPQFMKGYVVFIVILDTFHTVLCMHISYWYLVTNYFKPDRLFKGVWSLNLVAVTVGVTIVACQAFFARRVYVIGQKFRIVAVATGVMFLAELGFSIAISIKAFVLPNLAEFNKWAWLVSVAYGIAVGSNAMLTSILIFILHRSRTGFKRTDTIIDTLIRYAVCTGFVTDIFSVFALVFALIQPDNLIYTGIDLVTSKLYVNSVLAALNFREAILSQGSEEKNSGDIGMSVYQRSTEGASGGNRGWHSLQFSAETQETILDIKAAGALVRDCPISVRGAQDGARRADVV
ncbi:hypothetical protein BV20DRAFT_1057897 [Pilatotrama ljubarskyi]|nr:hypothetical protein BV20DRAFT_1057897 [Pilatotrama ljubarskyi]